jgi:acyl-lipid omega-6 desaturase (Delta-12 desaturase)
MSMTLQAVAAEAPEAKAWGRILARYREPSHARSLVEILVTAAPLALVWTAMWAALTLGHVWLYVLLIPPAAGLLVRLFMIQHDCGHGAFFRRRSANDWVGRLIGVLTLTPYDDWRHSHAIHHAGSGNLDRRGIGDIATLTVREYRALPAWRRALYRLYRHPLFLFGLAPAYLFLIQYRLPSRLMRAGRRSWISAMATNGAVAALAAAMIWLIGLGPFLLLYLPVMLLAAAAGVWLFYVQHQFEDTVWAEDRAWDHHEAALHGSSHYELPGVLRWFTANIGVHHVHHLSSRIPFYRLPQVLRDHPEFGEVGRLTLRESLGCVRLALWDEDQKRLVSFREARRLPAAG